MLTSPLPEFARSWPPIRQQIPHPHSPHTDADLDESGVILERDHQCAIFPFSHPVFGEFLGETHRGLLKLVRKRVNHAHHLGGPDARMRNLVSSGGPPMGIAACTRQPSAANLSSRIPN
jgi:hypothetical protein